MSINREVIFIYSILGIIFGLVGNGSITCTIVNEIKSSPLYNSRPGVSGGRTNGLRDDKSNRSKPANSLPSSITIHEERKESNGDNSRGINLGDEVAAAQFNSKLSRLYVKTPYSVKRRMFPKSTSNYQNPDKFVENVFKSNSMFTMENRIDEECVGHILEAEKMKSTKLISFKCPLGTSISYVRVEYKEYKYKPKKRSIRNDPELEHTETAITGLGFGCDDNKSFINLGTLARFGMVLSVPEMKKMWINKVTGYLVQSITGREYLSELVISGSDGTLGVNYNHENKRGEAEHKLATAPISHLNYGATKEWSGSFITGGCIGLKINKKETFISKIAMISVNVGPINGFPQQVINSNENDYHYSSIGVETHRVLALPKLWPECQMLFGRASGRFKSNFFLFKLPNSERELFFNFIEVKYNLKRVPISIEFKELVSKGSLFIGKKIKTPEDSSDSPSSVITVSRTGQISQITIGIEEKSMSRMDLGFVSYLEVVIDNISTIFIKERTPSFKRTFSGENLKYICAEISNEGNLLGFGAFFSNKLYVLPFSQGGVQTHYSDLEGVFSPNLYKSPESADVNSVPQYYLKKHKKRAELPAIEFIASETIDVYQGESILNSVCDFGATESNNEEVDYYLITCKPGYFLKSFNMFSYTTEDMIRGLEIGCGNGEVIIGERTPLKQGVRIVEHVNESESLGFEIGFTGSNLSENFALVSLKIFRNDSEKFNHKTVDIKEKKVIVSDEKVGWNYKKNGSFKGICFALDTSKEKIKFRGISIVEKQEKGKGISDSLIRPNILYPPDYRALGLGYIGFGDVLFASRPGVNAPEECKSRWIIERNIKKGEKTSDMGNFAFSCPKGHIITHIYASSNKKTKLMGIVGLLCSDGYSGAIIGTSKDLIDFKYVSLVENLLSLSPPYFITSVKSGIPKNSNDKFLAKLETYVNYANGGENGLFYKYISENREYQRKKRVKMGEINGGPFDTFCALIQTKLIRESTKLNKEGILNIGFGSSPKHEQLKGGNPIKSFGKIYVNQMSFPQCQMVRAPLSTETRETFAVSCPDGSKLTKFIPIKSKINGESKITAFLIICDSSGVALVGYTSHELDIDSFDNVPSGMKVYEEDLSVEHLTEISVSFDFKRTGIQGLDLHMNDGRVNRYPEELNKEEIKTLYTRKYVGNSLSMICLEFGETSKEVTGFGAYFKSQGLYWESDYILPPTQFPFDDEKKDHHLYVSPITSSRFISHTGVHLIKDTNSVCGNNWVGEFKNKDGNLNFGFSCGLPSVIGEMVMCFSDDLMEVVGVEGKCDAANTEKSFKVGNCDGKYKEVVDLKSNGVEEIDFGFSKKSNIFGFFSFSTTSGRVISKFRSKLMEFEGTGSSLYWSSEVNGDKMLSTICFNIDSESGRIKGLGVPTDSNSVIQEKIEPVMQVEAVIEGTESFSGFGRHYASEPTESRTVRGVPRVDSKMDLENVKTLTLNELYGGFISHDKNVFVSHCRKMVGIHKDDSRPTSIFCPKNHRVATMMLYLSSPSPNGIIVGMKVACHGQFEHQRAALEDSWTGMFQVGTITKYEYVQGTEPTVFRSLVFGLNGDNNIVYTFASDYSGRKYIEYSNEKEVVVKTTEYRQERYNHLRGLCFEMDSTNIHRIGFIIE
ncbi:hypothetical protein FG386_001445 [Cryptosporidium ryanae]|uniref:uncharacterized protein n=1 Tax=Cryptosporidium ryanae TaxID=515981 RepID=UPI00351A9B50|nr:hypothetical protein FG386_001445 [Cryptosporidium ryanae]